MNRIFLIGMWVVSFLPALGQDLIPEMQKDSLPTGPPANIFHSWGRIFGTADTPDDFLIYDACCPDFEPAIYIVGKAEREEAIEMTQRDSLSFFHPKDSLSDAFLACFSTSGKILWSTYLPALDSGYLNSFATTVQHTADSTIMVVGNAYRIENNISETRKKIPFCPGKLFFFEFDRKGRLLRSQTVVVRMSPLVADEITTPRIFSLQQDNYGNFLLSGHTIITPSPVRSILGFSQIDIRHPEDTLTFYVFPVHFTANVLTSYWRSFFYEGDTTSFTAYFWQNTLYHEKDSLEISRTLCGISHGRSIDRYETENKKQRFGAKGFSDKKNSFTESVWRKGETWSSTQPKILFSKGIDGQKTPPFLEYWDLFSDTNEVYGNPLQTRFSGEYQRPTFSGSIQNIHQTQGFMVVQGIHCQNYDNGFFRKGNKPYRYSHDTTRLFSPPARGAYWPRNHSYTSVPYLLVYDTSRFAYSRYYYGDDTAYIEPPAWGSFINADWFYEDLFHHANLSNLYRPYEPILCSSGNRFFLIGNARSISKDMLRDDGLNWYFGPSVNPDAHHQGILLAFQSTCGPEYPARLHSRFLCPGDSVELQLPAEFNGFRFSWDSTFLADGAITVSPDSLHAYAWKEGIYHAVLKSPIVGCPDLRTDTIHIRKSPYPEPQSGLPEDTVISCINTDHTLQAALVPDTSFLYRWYDGDTSFQKTIHFAGNTSVVAHVEIQGYCNTVHDSAFIRYLPPYVDLGKDTLLCRHHATPPDDTLALWHVEAWSWIEENWEYEWRLNGILAGNNPDLTIRYGDLVQGAEGKKEVTVTVRISLSDTAAGNCIAADTLHLAYFGFPEPDPNCFLPSDTLLCADRDLLFDLPWEAEAFERYWKDPAGNILPGGNDTSRFVFPGLRGSDGSGAGTDSRKPRLFLLELQHRFCPDFRHTDSLLVFDIVKPRLALPFHDTVLCFDKPVDLDWDRPSVYEPFYRYAWNTGQQQPEYQFRETGMYILEFSVIDSLNPCMFPPARDTVFVLRSDPALTEISLPADTVFCRERSVCLDASVPFLSTRYSWQKGESDYLIPPFPADSSRDTPPFIEIDEAGTYTIFLLDSLGCLNEAGLTAAEDECKPVLDIPNVFTPNGDGVNDILRFKQLEMCFDLDILIVDKKGTPVLQQKVRNADDFQWNGCLKNGSRKLPDGPYFYMISYKNAYGRKKIQSGSITILGSNE